ncbi:uncharacterized protein L3040_003272 [Drepanopeziza brunnea f. sp. 'multigermtubi']|uniref:Endo-1,3(4)-beta-glucanase, putative n=1 Tax=Marssonina brunnea f. sp. multigermtubi (strain MB_m1) TaxID=1072389 RepID=K1XTI4_MARBU|nr:endo-1,3(4)-beta-glucanase, putative [Drepanopeziza brunnea f. sp. 'multigermtubi' MB_m1]EKD15869.1 endo-1,3(4)-beta-glucanase, putative [Drepanopeziza brunnea f. sp. 'multigermtubi' MB_m1]KAJ5047445.1 hypothetical protein L3040_003272 [Drepanopeziza brunnea f. sp. 'multigermtubi']
MVLQNASATTANDSFEDSALSSDDDPYASSNSGSEVAQKYMISGTSLPKPIPIFGPLCGYNETYLVQILDRRVANGSRLLHRPLTQEEVDALVYHSAKRVAILSYGTPLGVVGGALRCYQTANTFQFPFYKPNLEKFNAQVFPPKFSFLTGSRAMLAWHFGRLIAYSMAGEVFGDAFMTSYALSVSAVGESSDKRLKPFIEAIQADLKRKRAAQKDGREPEQLQVKRGNVSSTRTGIETDWNPAQKDTPGEEVRAGTIESAMAVFQAGIQSERDSAPRPQWQGRPTPAVPTEESSPQPFGIFDDASPTGGQGVQADIRETPAASSPPSQGGSAWDRIRRGEKTTPAAERSTRKAWPRISDDQERGSGDDSFAFSKSEGERSFARQETQKEFDARMEKERRGGDFSNGNGDQRRW